MWSVFIPRSNTDGVGADIYMYLLFLDTPLIKNMAIAGPFVTGALHGRFGVIFPLR